MLLEAHGEGRLKFFGEHAALADEKAFKAFLAPLWRADWGHQISMGSML